MKIRNKIIKIVFTTFLLQLTSLKIFAQELTTRSPVDCYLGILASWSKRQFAQGSSQYVYNFQFLNTYPKAVKFRYYLKVGNKTIDGVTPKIASKGMHTDGSRLFSSAEVPECYIEDVCFEGMTCGGVDNCYAACSTEEQPDVPVIPCGLKGNQEEKKVKPVEKNEERNDQPVSGVYKIANITISQNCTAEKAIPLDKRSPGLKYCIEKRAPKEGSTLNIYIVHIYNVSAGDFVSVDFGLGTDKSNASNILLKSEKSIPPPIPANSTPTSNGRAFVFSGSEIPTSLYYKNVEITGIMDSKPRIKF